MPKKPPPTPWEAAKAARQRAALNALKKARRLSEKGGIKLSEWEDEFLGSVAERVKTYGRAFADPEKGDTAAPLSANQGLKLKQITLKAKGEERPPPKPRKPWRRKAE